MFPEQASTISSDEAPKPSRDGEAELNALILLSQKAAFEGI
jgi:hypothetical protein